MPLSVADAAHLCRRVGFAGTAAEIDHFAGREIVDVVDEVLSVPVNVPARPGWVDNPSWWEEYEATLGWWVGRMVNARWVDRNAGVPSPLVEKLSLFWHSHFACGVEKVESMAAMFDQNQLFRQHGLGDYETLVREVSLSGAMIRYIDNETNVRGSEQENFARELMELHTIGVGNYSEADVIAMAKAWTGHSIIGWVDDHWDATYRYYPEYHDDGQKTLFGITRRWNGPDTVTELVKGTKQDAAARFLAAKLWRFLVHSAPSTAVVNELAAVFVSSGMQLTELVRAILSHAEFWAPSTRWAVVRSPVEFVVDVLRRTAIPPIEAGLSWLLPSMGHSLLEPPNVAGWGMHGYWVSTAASWGKGRFLGYLRWNDRTPALFAPIESMSRPDAVAFIVDTLGIADASAATKSRIGGWFDATYQDHRWALKYNALMIGAMSPEFQVA